MAGATIDWDAEAALGVDLACRELRKLAVATVERLRPCGADPGRHSAR